MGTFLFDAPVFGPINSRRLGVSLGINLLPKDGKVCSFNCLYCECGLNEQRRSIDNVMPRREEVRLALEQRLVQMVASKEDLNVITFAGNGEPTLHPDFKVIVQDTIALRDRYFPKVKISVLSNSAHLSNPSVVEALNCIDNTILKLDSAIQPTFQCINHPNGQLDVTSIIGHLEQFEGSLIIQTLFCKGEYQGKIFDNTSDEEIQALIAAYHRIKPDDIMIYSLSRDTPVDTIYKIERDQLEQIALLLRHEGFNVEVA